MPSLFEELRRRNVLKVAAAYALVAWILIEAGSVLLPTFGAPEWFFRVYVMLVVGGWVVALIIAWIFEITPDGVKLEKDLDRESYVRPSRPHMNWVIIGLLVLALGVSVSFNVSGIRHDTPTVVESVQNDSIAVLPFESLSSDPENQFFTDGIHDDLMTRLSHVESLRVISRTSVFAYRDTAKNVRQIADELDVDTVVVGSVQQYGDKVRINVQLIDAISDDSIWAESYDESLTMENVFDIQSQISSEIAASLQAALTPQNQLRLAAVPTRNLDAYTLYVAGKKNLYLREFESLQAARTQFEQAIELDGDYAQAYAGLAQSIMLLMINHKAISPAEAYELAGVAVAKSLELDSQLAEAHAVAGLIESQKWNQVLIGDSNAKAAASYRRALELNPNLADALVWYASLKETEGDFAASGDLLRQAMQIDPLSRIPYVNLPSMLAAQGEIEQTTELLIKAIEIFPNWPTPYQYLSNHLERLGRLDEAVAWSIRVDELSDDPISGGNVLPIYHELGYVDLIDEFIAQFPEDHPLYPVGAGYIHFLNEDYAGTIEILDPQGGDDRWRVEMVYPVLVRAAVMQGNYDLAYDYLLRGFPSLASDARVVADRKTLGAVIMLAFLERRRGNHVLADELLEGALPVARQLPRVGLGGQGIKDVQILALQGRTDAALDALSEAVDEGFVSNAPFEMWSIDQDPLLDSLRNDPRYERLRLVMEEALQRIQRSIEQARSSGDWQSLRDQALTI